MFVLGILNIICGGIIIFPRIFKHFEYVTHATENILIILVGTLFLCTGFILIGISMIINRLEKSFSPSANQTDENISMQDSDVIDESWVCENCGTKNDKNLNNCGNCGKSKLDYVQARDGYDFVERKGKVFAIVHGGNPENYFCPYCYNQIDTETDSCSSCNRKF